MEKRISAQENFSYLTVALVILLFVSAVIDQLEHDLSQRFVEAAIVLTLVVGVWSLRKEPVWFRTGLGLVAAIALVSVTSLVVDLAGLHFVHMVALLGFLILTTWQAARHVLFTGAIDRNKIVGAICIYLLLGLIWAVLYLVIAEVFPTSFHGLPAAPWYEVFPDFIYFSFVSLTTLGFGDISPALPVPRFLVYMEAVVGQFYIAIVVATLVGARLSDLQSGR